MIPIHAYPKMNIHMSDYVPRFIDFGTIAINSKGEKEIFLRNIITLPFEFEFIPKKTCEEIKIEPLYGEIDAISNKSIIFTFSPKSYGLFLSEYEFRLSEFEYKPFLITITANCNVYEKVLNENILIHMKKQREKKNNILKGSYSEADNKIDDNYSSNYNNTNNKNNNTRNLVKGYSLKYINSPQTRQRTPNSNLHFANSPNENFKIALSSENSNNNNNIKNNFNTYTKNNSHEIIEENETVIKSSRRASKSQVPIADGKSSREKENQIYNNSKENYDEINNPKNYNEIEQNLENRDSVSNFVNTASNTKINNNNININNSIMTNTMAGTLQKEGTFTKKFKSFPTNKEREFLNYYNQIETTIKDKEIKYIKFIGKKLLTDDQTNKIISERIKEFENSLNLKRNLDLNRFLFELDSAKCCVDRLNQYFLKPTFNFNFNDKFFKTRNYFKIFLKLMTKLVIRKRAEKNMENLKKMLSRENIRNAKDFSDYADRDWTEQLTKDQETQESKMKIKFVKPPILTRSPVYLSYDYNLESLKQEITHENNINLEEIYEYKKFDPSDVEIVGYKGKN